MTQDEFLNEYISKNHRISEGYAYAIQASWYRQFERFLQNPSGVDVTRFNKIQNSQIAEGTIDMSVSLKQYSLPPYQQINYSHVYGLKPDAKFQTDFYIVSIDVWHFFKLYYGSDYDVIVFVTQQHPQMNNYLICDNFEEGLCICREIINVLFVIVFPRNISVMQAILTPISPWMDLIKFRAFLFAMHNFGIDAIKFINEGFIYFNNKKVPFKGNRKLYDIGINKDIQIVMACQNLLMQDIEEEIETDGEEQKLEQNLHNKQEFLEILEKTLNEQSVIQLHIKSIEEIQQSIDQNDFFQV
ncbi:unnamed protein product (macronuclear) [Paramecium tetraurelia]|uniref:DUSP domain-containing protein n=1 Tax=Paramecium tetraurelia TaxID=5888 RepID=A0BR15_PARTE|nr:uncharacterized protein GSPATT00031211001 [Paramecium tetraurelia]CAK60982.1 unnamed protein product [Paramecium tetraurelia]|eukprot:XP_001428380.1 hypothetical protein (macronuclear) [Paramecium tetraurelia strain d4-2]